MPLYIGVDPGTSGGIAMLASNGYVVSVVPMPQTERDVFEALSGWQREETPRRGPVAAVIEHVWSIPGQGGAFKFGRNVGHLQMALTAAGIPFDQILPRLWQKALGVSYPKGSTDTEKKNITKRRAQQLFPRLTITHAIADSLLLAEYCRRLHRGSHAEEGKEGGRQTRRREEGQADEGRRAPGLGAR